MIDPITMAGSVSPVGDTLAMQTAPTIAQPFSEVLGGMLDGAAAAVDGADAMAGSVAAGGGDVVAASIARAKADIALEAVSVAASRVSTAVNALLQTQV